MTKIEVTQEDINAGKEGDCNFCPIALALNRATGRLWTVNNYYCYERDIDSNRIGENIYFLRGNCNIPNWIFDFDKDGDVKPIAFELDI